MIERLQLTNCQSHKDSVIEFHPGLNVLVGDTDSGKSAVIRGLDKVIYNSMPSKELISHWGGPLIISLNVDGNLIILKNDGKDSYQLNDVTFAAIGSKIPEEVSTVLNMSDINIQNQIESFFLLTETSGYVASYLNEIANLSQIDSTTKAIKSELNETKRNIEHDKKTLAEKEKALETYAFLPQLEIELQEANTLEVELVTTEFNFQSIEIIINRIGTINALLLKIQKILSLKPLIESAFLLKDELAKTDIKISKLNILTFSLQKVDDKLEKLSKLSNLKSVINSTIKLERSKSDLEAKLDDLNRYISKVSTIDEELKTAMLKRESEHKLYHSELQKLDKCFFCGAKLN